MTTPANEGASLGWGLAALIVVLLIGTSLCSKGENQAVQPGNEAGSLNLAEAPAAEASSPLPLDRNAVQRGSTQLKVVASLGLPGSSQIFSQNCYDALKRKFDWHQLDRCGGFDIQAVRWAEQDSGTTADELDYFQSEAAATRFLTAATANGLEASDADLRWESLRTFAHKLALPKTRALDLVTNELGADMNMTEGAPTESNQGSSVISSNLN